MENITGLMAVFTKEILVMGPDMGMEFGKVIIRLIWGHIEWIISKGSECTHGRTIRYTKGSSETIIGTVMARYIR